VIGPLGAVVESVRPVRAEVAAAARKLAAEGLFVGTAGNLSAVDPETDEVAVTAAGVVLAECRPEDVTVVDRSGVVLEGNLAPTPQLELHLSVITATGARAVVHTHAPYAVGVGSVATSLPVLHYRQILLGGHIRVAPDATPGSRDLGPYVVDALRGRSAALIANHGAVTHGPTLAEAVEHALLLEWCCRLFWGASREHGTPSPAHAAPPPPHQRHVHPSKEHS
jgi:L-fuculose-phosphate aldolase